MARFPDSFHRRIEMRLLIAAFVVASFALLVQPADADARCCIQRAPVRRAVCFFRIHKPVRRAVKAVATAPMRMVKVRRCCR